MQYAPADFYVGNNFTLLPPYTMAIILKVTHHFLSGRRPHPQHGGAVGLFYKYIKSASFGAMVGSIE